MKEEVLKQKKLKVIRSKLKNESFFKTLINTGRYKEVFSGKEAFASLIISILLFTPLTLLFLIDRSVFLEYLPPLLVSIITGFITLIALSLSAFALVISSFNRKSFLELIIFNEEENEEEALEPRSETLINNMITILYRFYFAAGFNVISVFLLVIIYIYVIFPSLIWLGISLFLGFLVLYLVVFSLIFTLTLFSTCIKLPFYF